jgi:phosphonate transport system substrate-binding protein
MGVHPYKPPVELHKIFKPIADYISKETGKKVELRIGQTYEDAGTKIGTGVFDFAYISPVIYVEAQKQYGLVPLAIIANNGSPTYHGVITVKKGSPITSLTQLKGKKFAFGARNSNMNHTVPLWMLLNSGVKLTDLQEYNFLKTHDNVAMNIIRGTFDAGGMQPDIAEKYAGQGLQVLVKSPELPEHVFVANKSLDAATLKAVQKALNSPNAVPVLKGIKSSISGAPKFADADFDILRKIVKEVGPYLDK